MKGESVASGSRGRADRSETLRIYLARHAETQWNAEGRFQGSADMPLNDRGRAEPVEAGESSAEHAARVLAAARHIQDAHPTGNVLVIGHGGTNQQLLRAWLGIPREEAMTYHQDYAGLLVVERTAWGGRLITPPV